MATAAFLYEFVINDVVIAFKSITATESVGEIDATSRANPDGSTNEGFSSFDRDVKTLTIEADSLIKTPTGSPPDLDAGVNDVEWSLTHDGDAIFSGSSLFVREWSYSGSVPGEGRLRLSCKANGPYSKA